MQLVTVGARPSTLALEHQEPRKRPRVASRGRTHHGDDYSGTSSGRREAGDRSGRGAQTIEGFVGAALDDAKISPLHRRVIGLIAAGYFCDVIDFTVFGSLVPFILKSGFGDGRRRRLIGSATIFGLAIGTAGQGEFSDRFGRRFIYQFNLLLFGIFTILGALAPSVTAAGRSAASSPASVWAPSSRLPSPMPANMSPKRIRGRILAIVHFIGGACVWPIGTGLVLGFGGYASYSATRHAPIMYGAASG